MNLVMKKASYPINTAHRPAYRLFDADTDEPVGTIFKEERTHHQKVGRLRTGSSTKLTNWTITIDGQGSFRAGSTFRTRKAAFEAVSEYLKPMMSKPKKEVVNA